MVPEAEFTSYYGRPILKTPTWKNPDVPLYLWLGGMAGTSAVVAALADATGRPVLRRGGRLVAAGGAALGTVALIHDLGRPARFLNMLRVLKPTSPLSVGSWILAPFATAASAAAASEVTGIAPALGRAAGWGAAAFGPPLASYTGVLLADTAIPAWHEAHGELPVLFAASGAVAGATAELAAGTLLERRLEQLPGGVVDAWRTGRAGRWNRLARALTVAGGFGALVTGLRGQPSRAAAVGSGAALAAGSLATRFAAFEAGRASAAAPEHVVAPQRARFAAH
jgi:hypothetical protein